MMFQSFFQGGFECSTHRRADGTRLDVISSTRHDLMVATDYALLKSLGLETIRDGVRWHLIEQTPGVYDWSSLTPMLHAARGTQTQVIWDILHYGWPDWLDIWSVEFIERFGAFSRALALHMKNQNDDIPWYVPVNEISFLAWGGGQFELFNPMARGRGHDLKCQLVRAAVASIDAIWSVEPRARFVHTDPLIHVHAISADDPADAHAQTEAQFHAWDMISGRRYPELGGKPEYLDVIGVNYYCHNQWELEGPPLDWRGFDPRYIPFRELLAKTHRRYQRPMFVAETGIEAELRPEWFNYVCAEVFAAIESGTPIGGICLYPVMNHPGWDDDRHCPNGLIDYDRTTFKRSIVESLATALRAQLARSKV